MHIRSGLPCLMRASNRWEAIAGLLGDLELLHLKGEGGATGREVFDSG